MLKLLQVFAQEYTCPILKTIIQDPVIAYDGHTYQRQAIENWFKTSRKSPITGEYLNSINLIPNISLRNLKQKIAQLLPKQIKSIKKLHHGNEKLTQALLQKNQEFDYHKQISDSKQIVSNQLKNQLKIKQNALNQRLNQIKQKNVEIQQLQQKINVLQEQIQTLQKLLQKQQKQSKKKIKELNEKLQTQEKKNQQKISETKRNYQWSFNSLNSKTQQIIKVFLAFLSKLFEQINQQENKTKQKLIKFQQKLEKSFQNHYFYSNSYNYKIFKFLAQNTKLDNFMQSNLIVFPKVYFEIQSGYGSSFDVTTVQTVIQLQKKIDKNTKKFQIYELFASNIKGIENYYNNFNDFQWQQVLKASSRYPNVETLVLQCIDLKYIKKQDLQKFPKLKFVHLIRHKLNQFSMQQIELYKSDHPNVTILENRSPYIYDQYEDDYYDDGYVYGSDQ